MIEKLIKQTRTVRKYREAEALGEDILTALVDLARLGGSARNAQPLKYMIINQDKLKKKLFPFLGWAGYLSDWPGPAENQRPAAYIICLLDRELSIGPEAEAHFDLGIASQNLLLGAAEKGIFGCRIASFSPKLKSLLCLEDNYKILLVIALGYPAEDVVLEPVGPDQDIRYWRDENQRHHVPKRSLAEIIIPASNLV